MTASPERPRLWPSSPYEIADATRCPSCFAPASPPICDQCGLLLDDPRTPRLVELGGQILSIELKRQAIMDAIRLTQLQAAAAAAAAAMAPPVVEVVSIQDAAPAAVPMAVVDSGPMLLAEPVPAAPAAIVEAPPAAAASPSAPAAPTLPPPFRGEPPVAAAPPAEPRAPRRKLSVPVLLLIVGVTLVGVAAIFFLVYAWFVWGIAVRALIIGAITLASIATASLLRRRSLTATAEGIAVLGVVLLGLDAWAVRANDFFGTGASDPAVYAGVSALVIGVICRVWAGVSRLRGPDVAAALALPAGLGLVIGGVLDLPSTEALVAGLLGAAAGGLLHAVPAPWSSARTGAEAIPERTVLAVIGVASLTAAAAAAALLTADAVPVLVWSTAGVLGVGIAHAVLLRTREGAEPLPAARGLAEVASSVAVAAVGLLGWQLAFRVVEPVYSILVAPLLAVGTAVAVDALRARRGGMKAAWATSGIIGALSVVSVMISWAYTGVGALSSDWSTWTTDPLAVHGGADAPFLALPVAIVLAALLFAAPSLRRRGFGDARVVTAALLILAGAARSGVPALLVGVAVLIAVAATLALVRATSRPGWLLAAASATVIAYGVGTAAPWLWLIGVAIAIALPIAVRALLRPAGEIAVVLAIAPVAIAALSALIAPAALSAVTGMSGGEWQVAVALLQWVALATLAVALIARTDETTRSALALAAWTLVASTLVWTAAGYSFIADAAADAPLRGAIADPALGIVRGVALVAAFALIATGRTRLRGTTAYLSAALVAPSLAYAIHETLGVLGVRNLGAVPIVPVTGAVAVVGIGAWAALARDDTPALRMTRLAADIGAVATALIVVWTIGSEYVWEVWGLAALGFTALAATTGWAAPATSPETDVFATRTTGAPFPAAPRRILVWPAVIALVVAWWSLLGAGTPGTVFTTEVESIPAGVAFIAFAALLVWLRRRGEAAVALGAGLALALWPSAVEGWSGAPLRGTLVAVAAAVICLALSAPPLRGIRPPALAGAGVALVGVALVTIERALNDRPEGSAWLVLLVGVAYASGLGMAVARPADISTRVFALLVPVLALGVSVIALYPSTDVPAVVAVALGVLAALHLGAAALHRLPLTGVTRWTAVGGAAVVATGAMLQGGADDVEWVSLPIAAMLLAGAVLGSLRRRRESQILPGAEAPVWLAGLVLATLPSIIAPAEPARVWTVIVAALVAAAAAALSRIPDSWTVREPSALLLGIAAVAMGARALAEPSLASAEAAAVTAACGAVAVAVLLVATSRADRATWPPTLLAALGSGLLVYVVLARSDGELATSAVTAALGGAVGVVGAALLGIRRWTGVAGVLSIAGLVVAVAACGVRFAAVLTQPGFEADFWVLAGGAIVLAIVLTALRAVPTRKMGSAAGAVLGAAVVAFAAAEFLVLQTQSALAQPEAVQDARTVLTMSVLTAAAVAGAVWRTRIDVTIFIAAAAAAPLFGIAAVAVVGIEPFELVSVPPALGGIAYGAFRLTRDPGVRTWPSLGPWLALLTVPSLVQDFGQTELWRVVALGVVGIAMVVVGAVLRLQAPLVLGSIIVVTHAVAQLWPWIRAGYDVVPWWLWLGIGGALLIFLAATYERRVRQMRTAFVAVTSLR
ncbi:DUF2157 domain-containing protein [Microbacterium sp. SS28]|uniref:DUF2157 domain-containing protein n=1 Tax=Microbacterium sp. SS28 TaxID=2919948 RepID=UPI001FAB2CC8|nr:DUF2157 domain-containing protein [Microbacterium sp. SS28]